MSDEIDNQEIQEIKKELKKYIIKPSHYKMIRPIGKGGYAEVYLAKDKRTGENVAYKQLFKSLQPKQLTHFAREVSTMARVNHPFLLKFYGFSPNHPLAIVTEYIKNGSLFSYIHSESGSKKLTGSHRTLISMAIANAMVELHKLGIIHRDLKSLNILLDKEFLPRLGDFGIARYMNDDEPMTMRLGTPHWMAPETLKGNKNYGPEVDVYSFGMLLYELLTNLIPWEGRDPVAVATAVVNKERPELPEDTPEPLRDLIESCWSQKPSKRPTFTEIYDMFKNREVKFKGTDDEAIKWLDNKVETFERERAKKKNKKKSKRKNESDDYTSTESSSNDSNSRTKKRSKNRDDENEFNSRKNSKDKKSRNVEEEESSDSSTIESSEEILRMMHEIDSNPTKSKSTSNKRRKSSRPRSTGSSASSDSSSSNDNKNKTSRNTKRRKRNEYDYNSEYDYEDNQITFRKTKSEKPSQLRKQSTFGTDDIFTRNRTRNVDTNTTDEILRKKKTKQNTADNIFQDKKKYTKRGNRNDTNSNSSDEDNYNKRNRQTHTNRANKRETNVDSTSTLNEVNIKIEEEDKYRKSRRKPRFSDISLPLKETASSNREFKNAEITQKRRLTVQSDSNLISNEEKKNDFQSINEQFRPIISSNTPIIKKTSTLRQIALQIMNDRLYAQNFVNNGFHQRLPLSLHNEINDKDDLKSIQIKQLIDNCFDAYLSLFQTVPEKLQSNFEETMKSLIHISPRRSIILLANFSSQISHLDNPWPLLDLMINESSTFIENKSGNMLIMTLFYLCMNNKIFKESRLADCVVVFLDGIRCTNLSTIRSSYNALCFFYDGDEEVDFESICMHIKDDRIKDNALNFLLRLEKIPIINDLIQCLLEEARANEKATLCLIKIAQTKEGAMAILEIETKWISEPLPTIEKTMQLFLSVLKFPEISRFIMNSGKRKEAGLFNNNYSLPTFQSTNGSITRLEKNSNITYSGRFDITDSSELTKSLKLDLNVYDQIMQLYLLICNSNDSNLLLAAAATIEAFSTSHHYNYSYPSNFNYTGVNNAITLEFLGQLQSSRALLRMLKLALSLDNAASVKAGLVMIDILSDVDYSKEYVVFAAKIADLIFEDSDKAEFAIHLATKLSKFDLCAKKFNDLKLKDFFLDLLKDKEYRDEAEFFIKNIDKFTQYY